MASYAKVENGVVVNVIEADAEFINAGHAGEPSSWVEVPEGKVCGIDYTYSEEHNWYIPPKHYQSWVFSEEVWDWLPPFPPPMNIQEAYGMGIFYTWNEERVDWDVNEIPDEELGNVINTIEQQRAEGAV